jgi:hypothetical protein
MNINSENIKGVVENTTQTNKPTKRVKITVNWPEGFFSMKDVAKQNPNINAVTLRYKVNEYHQQGNIIVIGRLTHNSMGRPLLVFAPKNVDDVTLMLAMSQNVDLDPRFKARATKFMAEFPSTKNNNDNIPESELPELPELPEELDDDSEEILVPNYDDDDARWYEDDDRWDEEESLTGEELRVHENLKLE